MLEILALPFAACLVLTAIHVYLGLHVLARGVIFVDLALAQVAALGLTVAILAGHAPSSEAAYWYALVFAIGGAGLFAWTRTREERVPQEAVIGIVYAVSAALAIIVVDRAPQGAEHIKQLLVGSLLSVTGEDVVVIAVLYAIVGALHWKMRRTMLAVSFGSAQLSERAMLGWDLLFFATFALVVTSSVRIAGVLLVFSFLVVPAAIGALLASTVRGRLAIGWAVGALVSAAGLGISWAGDLPTGAAVVATFGAAIAFVALALWGRRLAGATRRRGARALLPLVMGLGIVIAAAGALLTAFPRMDQPWLDLAEKVAPPIQTVFLTEPEREVRSDAVESIARAEEELARLRKVQDDVNWGIAKMDDEKQERMRQYVAGRSEILAGDQLSLRGLRTSARERQRFVLGVPLVLLGAAVFIFSRRVLRSS
jgi:zinc/manganese transport system permease protein